MAMTMKHRVLGAVMLGLAVAGAVRADAPQLLNLVNFDTSVTREVTNDQAAASLFVELSDADAARLAERINQTLAAGVALAKRENAVQVQGTSYRTFPVYSSNNKLTAWRSRGELRVSSRDFAALSRLINELQKPQANGQILQLEGVQYSVSEQARKQVEEQLLKEGVAQFRQRAQTLQQSMNAKGWTLVQMNVNSNGGMPAPQFEMRTMALAKGGMADAAPPMEAGESRLSVQVNGVIQLQP